MTNTNMDLTELLAKQDGGDFLRAVAEAVLQLIMEADVEGMIGVGKHERSTDRATWRNWYRERALDTSLGTLNLKVPKLRQGSYLPGFLEPRKTSEKALVAVCQWQLKFPQFGKSKIPQFIGVRLSAVFSDLQLHFSVGGHVALVREAV